MRAGTDREAQVATVMVVLQDGRGCTPYTCEFCRKRAEAIVDKIAVR